MNISCNGMIVTTLKERLAMRKDQINNDQGMNTGKGAGMQGIDKAPGEEPAQSTENVRWETQKGKNKVDGDPSLETDKPIEQGKK
jgi:hypothetical protein